VRTKIVRFYPSFLGAGFYELWGFLRGTFVQITRKHEVAGSFWTGSTGYEYTKYVFLSKGSTLLKDVCDGHTLKIWLRSSMFLRYVVLKTR
jgi:hypothetical protein